MTRRPHRPIGGREYRGELGEGLGALGAGPPGHHLGRGARDIGLPRPYRPQRKKRASDQVTHEVSAARLAAATAGNPGGWTNGGADLAAQAGRLPSAGMGTRMTCL
jgi:hypothetical protein